MNSQKWGPWAKGKCSCSCNYDGRHRFAFTAVESFCTSVGIHGYISLLADLSVAGGQVCKLLTGEKCYQGYDLHFHSFIFHFRFFFLNWVVTKIKHTNLSSVVTQHFTYVCIHTASTQVKYSVSSTLHGSHTVPVSTHHQNQTLSSHISFTLFKILCSWNHGLNALLFLLLVSTKYCVTLRLCAQAFPTLPPHGL